ncbi:hypothetical protein GGTG_04970 [Gaeumannomyces tritici R3-111a-1]|uniref:Uncharacterized protein n=1 Tax=Gaeumannomyces tritici (strain R3-111a-1) TaxID=644352 RepID=J3NUL5_GAET3|nr:hypothetical protein GGTG_04970 [Gaeumannomyces tritici R3-111a-1]EJT79888.1 hypothetical protein GGTG_04970 [Gaeumannomyces tritici R3-111a-1]
MFQHSWHPHFLSPCSVHGQGRQPSFDKHYVSTAARFTSGSRQQPSCRPAPVAGNTPDGSTTWTPEQTATLMGWFLEYQRTMEKYDIEFENYSSMFEHVLALAVEEWPDLAPLISTRFIYTKFDHERKRCGALRGWVEDFGGSCDPDDGRCEVDRPGLGGIPTKFEIRETMSLVNKNDVRLRRTSLDRPVPDPRGLIVMRKRPRLVQLSTLSRTPDRGLVRQAWHTHPPWTHELWRPSSRAAFVMIHKTRPSSPSRVWGP